MRLTLFSIFTLALLLLASTSCSNKEGRVKSTGPRKIEILFLGHNSEHHNSARYLPLLASTLSKEGINFTYTDDPDDLKPEILDRFDGLMIYANYDSITTRQERALLDFVEEGKGFMPIHCASFCFRNSDAYINLVGGQFQKHDTATFTANIVNKEHPVVGDSLNEFATWDETYIHHKLSNDRTVLMERVEGDHHEPWTWIRQQGKGRVFYTAYGHDERTWNKAGFQQLMKQGIVWAVGDEIKKQWEAYRATMPQLVYEAEPNIPNYEKRDPWPQYQEPLSPEESQKLIQVPVGFNLELFASEPDIINPIAMDWDERGRLWVIETVDYPNSVRDDKGQGDDRIKICEDTDGDGRADKFTVFADNLNIPTSLVFSNGGIIVSQAPHFIFLKDTNGDDKADVRRNLIEGWGTFDTHAGPSNLRYGMDNSIWGVVGYSGFKGTIAGRSLEFSQGVYKFKPDISDFEFVASTSNNTWGLGFTEDNDVFASTANNTHSVFLGINDRFLQDVEGIGRRGGLKIDGHYAMHPITEKVRQVDVFGGFTAAAGHNFYTARNYPKAFWNNVAFVCEPTGHLVHIAKIQKEGAGFAEKDGWNLFASADEWVSPVEAKVGPDGAVWVLDWYDFIIQHNPTPTEERGGYEAKTGEGNAYENPLRDKAHGRIWRVVSQDAKPSDMLELSKEQPEELLKALGSDNMLWRLTAQRLLVERANSDLLPELYDLASEDDLDEEGNNHTTLHALWTLDGLGAFAKEEKALEILKETMKHKSPALRKAAIQIALKSHLVVENEIIDSGILSDPDANTKLAGILALCELPASDKVGQLVYRMSLEEKSRNDKWLSRALYAAATHHRDGFISEYLKENKPHEHLEETVVAREVFDLNDSHWKDMMLPRYIEDAGLNMDGIVWFRRNFEIDNQQAGKKAVLSLGPIDDSDDTWVNGVKVGETRKLYNASRKYTIPAGLLKVGRNTISVKVEDTGGGGGIYGKPEDMFIQLGNKKIPLNGAWKYDVESRSNVSAGDIFRDESIAEVFVKNYGFKTKSNEPEIPSTIPGATVIRISVIKNKMQYDLKSFSVEAGKPVEIVFQNPDFMQHNLLILKPGSLPVVGKAADKLASDPKGSDMQYVPKMPEVLFATKLVNPEETVRLTFTAPKDTGDYPFVCTFPGHWSIMNGVMKVVKKK
jgi:putative membrane-bound dehydrogenase-like protein